MNYFVAAAFFKKFKVLRYDLKLLFIIEKLKWTDFIPVINGKEEYKVIISNTLPINLTLNLTTRYQIPHFSICTVFLVTL